MDVTHLYRTRVCVLRHERMKGALFLRFARIVYAFICPDGYLPSQQKTRLKRLFEARAVPLKHGVGVFAIFAGAQYRCHIVWLHVVFVCCKMYAQHLARNEAARFYLSTLRVFCVSLFFCLVSLLILYFLAFPFLSFSCLLACLLSFPTFLLSYLSAFLPSYLLAYIIYNKQINNIYIYLYRLCARACAREECGESKAQKKSGQKAAL